MSGDKVETADIQEILRLLPHRYPFVMIDRIIHIERHRHDANHWVRPSPPTSNTEQRYDVFYEGNKIGVWRVPSCDAARWLLEHGAARSDRLRTYRGDMPCMSGSVGWFADRTVNENATPRWVRWRSRPEGLNAVDAYGLGTASEEI